MSVFNHIMFLRAIWQRSWLYQALGVTQGHHNSKYPPLPPSSLSFYCWTQMPYGLEHAFGQLGSAVLAVSPPSFLCSPRLLAGRAAWEGRLWCCLCPAQQSLNHPCVTSTAHHKSKTHPCTSNSDESQSSIWLLLNI